MIQSAQLFGHYLLSDKMKIQSEKFNVHSILRYQ